MVALLVALQIWCLSKVRNRPASRKGDFGNFFLSFSFKARNYYPAYHIGPDFSNLKVPALSENSLHGNVLSFNAIICCAKEARALIVADIK